jgi:UDP-glucuronate 4-epimerase
MKYLVTGGAGFIGFHTARRLLSEGNEVVIVDNFNPYYDVKLKRLRQATLEKEFPNKVKFYEVNIENFEKLNEVFEKEKINAVIHLAAQAGVRHSLINPFVYVTTNVLGTLNMFECCKRHKIVSMVYASSSSVYGGNAKYPSSETDNVDKPISLYAQTKRDNELMAYTYYKNFGISSIGLRFFTVYGPFGRPDMAGWLFAEAISRGEPIKVFNHGNMKRDFTFVTDIVDGIRKASAYAHNNNCCEVINLGNNKPVELGYFISIIERHAGKTAKKELLPMQQGDVPESCADISKAKRLLDWEPKVGIEEGLDKFIAWHNEYTQ